MSFSHQFVLVRVCRSGHAVLAVFTCSFPRSVAFDRIGHDSFDAFSFHSLVVDQIQLAVLVYAMVCFRLLGVIRILLGLPINSSGAVLSLSLGSSSRPVHVCCQPSLLTAPNHRPHDRSP